MPRSKPHLRQWAHSTRIQCVRLGERVQRHIRSLETSSGGLAVKNAGNELYLR